MRSIQDFATMSCSACCLGTFQAFQLLEVVDCPFRAWDLKCHSREARGASSLAGAQEHLVIGCIECMRLLVGFWTLDCRQALRHEQLWVLPFSMMNDCWAGMLRVRD